jgi:hypothetical protein
MTLKLNFSFKFYVDNKKAQVLIDIEPRNNDTRNAYFDKLEALKIYWKKNSSPI